MKICITYVTFPNADEASEMILQCLNHKLIACGNILPSQSIYMWNGNFHNETEQIAIMKTSISRKEDLANFIQNIHPYEIPAILQWEVEANEEYAKWVETATA